MSAEGRAALEEIYGAVGHLRQRAADSFRARVFERIRAVDAHALRGAFYAGVTRLVRSNWSLAPPYLDSVRALPPDCFPQAGPVR